MYQPTPIPCPGCHRTFAGTQALAAHKRTCEALEQAIYDEVKRIADQMQETPRITDYDSIAAEYLPRSVWIINYIGAWNEIVLASGAQRTTCECGADVVCKRYWLCSACYTRRQREKAKINHETNH